MSLDPGLERRMQRPEPRPGQGLAQALALGLLGLIVASVIFFARFHIKKQP